VFPRAHHSGKEYKLIQTYVRTYAHMDVRYKIYSYKQTPSVEQNSHFTRARVSLAFVCLSASSLWPTWVVERIRGIRDVQYTSPSLALPASLPRDKSAAP